MKHLLLGGAAGAIAVSITVLLHFWGAHDIQGLFLAVVGFPGLLASGNGFNEGFFTLVNCAFYFAVLEGVVALKDRFFTKRSA